MEQMLLISDAAKKVDVEAHVLRYWEEELNLPIKRNELGHRYYTEEDVERFKEVKELKERGLQLKAIRMILKNENLQVVPSDPVTVSKEEKMLRLQWLLKQLFAETLQENNQMLLKELDYQFRMQEEREEERDREKQKRDEDYYKRIDELLRKKRRHGADSKVKDKDNKLP